MVTLSSVLLALLFAAGPIVGAGIYSFFYKGPPDEQILYPEEVLPRGNAL